MALKKERVKKIDNQHPVRRDMAYDRLKMFSYVFYVLPNISNANSINANYNPNIY